MNTTNSKKWSNMTFNLVIYTDKVHLSNGVMEFYAIEDVTSVKHHNCD